MNVIAAKTAVGIDRLGNIAYEAQIFAGTDDKVGCHESYRLRTS
jgi:hypothetical protein